MAFDHENHTIHPVTGFQIDKNTGHHIGMHQAPIGRVSDETEWPKWVTPHDNHIVSQSAPGGPAHVSTPRFEHFHVNRVDGSVTVMVNNAEEEARALADPRTETLAGEHPRAETPSGE